MEKKRKILVVAPHPDDEVLGCGGIIKKHSTLGDEVFILVVSRGKKGVYPEEKITNVRNEARKAHKILGVAETIFLDFPAPELDLVSISKLAVAIESVVIKYNTDTVYLPHGGDVHHDHKSVYNAGLVATRPVNRNPVKKVYSYETLSETEWASPTGGNSFIPTYYVNISGFLNFKLVAMKCFNSQLKEFPNPRSIKTIESLATLRGSHVGFSYAEAFMIIRDIDD